jgi:hypothetical protein
MLRTCFVELMDKEAMRSLEIPKWINANNAYTLRQQKKGLNGNHVNGDTKKTKAERSTELGIGLARLAHRCHVSPHHNEIITLTFRNTIYQDVY